MTDSSDHALAFRIASKTGEMLQRMLAVDACVHGGGLNEWDVRAPDAVAEAAGLLACRLGGIEP